MAGTVLSGNFDFNLHKTHVTFYYNTWFYLLSMRNQLHCSFLGFIIFIMTSNSLYYVNAESTSRSSGLTTEITILSTEKGSRLNFIDFSDEEFPDVLGLFRRDKAHLPNSNDMAKINSSTKFHGTAKQVKEKLVRGIFIPLNLPSMTKNNIKIIDLPFSYPEYQESTSIQLPHYVDIKYQRNGENETPLLENYIYKLLGPLISMSGENIKKMFSTSILKKEVNSSPKVPEVIPFNALNSNSPLTGESDQPDEECLVFNDQEKAIEMEKLSEILHKEKSCNKIKLNFIFDVNLFNSTKEAINASSLDKYNKKKKFKRQAYLPGIQFKVTVQNHTIC